MAVTESYDGNRASKIRINIVCLPFLARPPTPFVNPSVVSEEKADVHMSADDNTRPPLQKPTTKKGYAPGWQTVRLCLIFHSQPFNGRFGIRSPSHRYTVRTGVLQLILMAIGMTVSWCAMEESKS
ncbi:FRAS1-related extracellular matrix protein 2-like protein [Anopheles sinensis]|uniref:FRAS1-related extracellular matrix protein 2-like protein n=1 Tax=Anopheles sinensis TaxID=74873 RepID=A0A084VNG1_ANOSI|nr:FRAS1-related extracellular matrix protein 2-like protein [Anopheles sinensis]